MRPSPPLVLLSSFDNRDRCPAETQENPKKSRPPTALYPWLRRDYFKTSVSYLVSLGVHALIFLFFLTTIVLDGGGGLGDSMGGKGEAFSMLVGHGMLDEQTQRTDESKFLQEEIAKAVEQIRPLPEVESETTPDLSDFGVRLVDVAPRINPMPNASALRNMPPPSTGGGMALGPGIGEGGGAGGGIGRGFGRGFGDFIGLLEKTGFDVGFVIDATGSMEFVIDTVKARLTNLVDAIRRLVPNTRVVLVLYKDQGDDFVVRKSDLTFHLDKLRSVIGNIQAGGGGGDWEEGVLQGLEAAVNKMSWRVRSRKIIVVVANSPPHAQDWPEIDRLVEAFRRRGGLISAVDAAMPEFSAEVRPSLTRITGPGGGEIVAVGEPETMIRTLMVVAFGQQWEANVAAGVKD